MNEPLRKDWMSDEFYNTFIKPRIGKTYKHNGKNFKYGETA